MDNRTKVRELESAVELLSRVNDTIQGVLGSTEVGDEYRDSIANIIYDLRSDIDTITALYGA
jgi:hypothetical protein